MTGILVTIEGGEGTGKTTQARLLAETLAAEGRSVLSTREPGGAPGAEALRAFLLEQDHGLALRAEVMVHLAARLDHVERTIQPALRAGSLVLCDRFSDSTLAYQGYGLGFGDPSLLGFIDHLTALIPVRPRITLVLDLPVAQARQRIERRARAADRYESLDDAFHARVAEGYRTIARAASDRCVLLSSLGPVDAVRHRLLAALRPAIAP